MKPMNEAFGRASRMCRAKPSMKSYWLRWASSAMTTMLRRSESSGYLSPFSSGKNFWIVVKTTPPEATVRASAQVGAVSACTGFCRSSSWQRGERAEELVVEVVAVGEDDERRVLHRRVQDDACRRRRPSSGSCRSPACARRRRRAGRPWARPRARVAVDRLVDGVELVVAGHLLDELAAAVVLEDDEVADEVEKPPLLEDALEQAPPAPAVAVGASVVARRWSARA